MDSAVVSATSLCECHWCTFCLPAFRILMLSYELICESLYSSVDSTCQCYGWWTVILQIDGRIASALIGLVGPRSKRLYSILRPDAIPRQWHTEV